MRRSIVLGAVLAAAVVCAAPEQSQAQGFGFRIGNVGVGVGNYYGGGFGYGGIGYGYGYPYYGYRSYYGSPYGWNTTGYSWAPGYSRWYAPSSYYYGAPGYSYYSDAPVTTQSFYQGNTQSDISPNAALVRVAVPSNARLYFQDQETNQRGNERLFYSPPLTPGKDFIYTLKATWTDADGKEVTRTREVRVKAGSTVNVDMMAANEIRSGYQPADQAKPAPADNNPNAYRGPREVTPLTPGTPPAAAPAATTTQQPVPAQPAPGVNPTVIVPGGVGIAPNLGNTTPVPQGTIARPGTNEPNVVPPVNTSTPGSPPVPAGTAPIGPATPANPTIPALNPNAPSNLPGPAPRQ